MGNWKTHLILALAGTVPCVTMGCRSVQQHRREADEAASKIIAEKQKQALGKVETLEIVPPADMLRKRLLLEQDLPYAGPSSLGTTDLKAIKHWPKDDYLDPAKRPPASQPVGWTGGALHLSLMEALQVAANNSRDYQSRKETIFQDALSLELERDQFRTQLAAAIVNDASLDLGGDDAVAGVVSSPSVGVTQKLKSGGSASVRLGVDLVKLLTQRRTYSKGIGLDASVAIPLMRGAGQYIVMEPLTQAERNVAYDLLDFEQYKRQFAVNVASSYLSVLQAADRIINDADSYRRYIVLTRRSQRLAEAGTIKPLEYDQALQQELQARDNWIASQQQYKSQLDSFKVLLGLPPDAEVELDRVELVRLAEATRTSLRLPSTKDAAALVPPQPTPSTMAAQELMTQPTSMPATEDVVLAEPSMENAGPYELPEQSAEKLAIANRPDLRVAQGEVYDSERNVVVVANALEMGLDVTGTMTAGERRGSLGSANLEDGQLHGDKAAYNVGLDLDLPLERTREQNAYRASLISLERAVRAVQAMEDDIKLSVRNQLRSLLQNRESLRTQVKAVAIAQRRVSQQDMLLLAGRAVMRDVLDAQAALVSAQNALTSALVSYRRAELQLQRDMGLLEVNNEGLWRDYSPKGKIQ
ncbi:MAG TPA: TolC family protein [Tepidisphaeraceae bacterium]|nr:TolC family protein [Tepidisphaeraceae bacterium]